MALAIVTTFVLIPNISMDTLAVALKFGHDASRMERGCGNALCLVPAIEFVGKQNVCSLRLTIGITIKKKKEGGRVKRRYAVPG